MNCAELISKWVGETGKNIEAVRGERSCECGEEEGKRRGQFQVLTLLL